jgi:hypothetical protein
MARDKIRKRKVTQKRDNSSRKKADKPPEKCDKFAPAPEHARSTDPAIGQIAADLSDHLDGVPSPDGFAQFCLLAQLLLPAAMLRRNAKFGSVPMVTSRAGAGVNKALRLVGQDMPGKGTWRDALLLCQNTLWTALAYFEDGNSNFAPRGTALPWHNAWRDYAASGWEQGLQSMQTGMEQLDAAINAVPDFDKPKEHAKAVEDMQNAVDRLRILRPPADVGQRRGGRPPNEYLLVKLVFGYLRDQGLKDKELAQIILASGQDWTPQPCPNATKYFRLNTFEVLGSDRLLQALKELRRSR